MPRSSWNSGLTHGAAHAQVISDPGTAAHAVLERLRNEYVVLVTGTVRARSSANTKVATGNVEVVAESVTILNTVTRSLPFSVSAGEAASEEVRLKYVAAGAQFGETRVADAAIRVRYRALDLRRPALSDNLRLRHRIIMALRRVLEEERGFIEARQW